MSKKHFAVYLRPSRPDFSQTMTEEERGIMQAHVTYWTKLMQEGTALVFGPVLHPEGAYGLGIVSIDHEDRLPALLGQDPAARLAKHEAFPMLAVTAAG